MALDYFSLGHPLSGWRTFFALRARKKMFNLFMSVAQPSASDTVLDLGVTPDCSLAESNFFERLYPYRGQITAASIEDASNLEQIFLGVKFRLVSQGLQLPFASGEFDVVFCSAVLEHVGTREDQRKFLYEIGRVSKKFFLTTPNRWFPLDFHTLIPLAHWLPQKWHQRILRWVGQDFLSRIENLNLLGTKDLTRLLPEGFQYKFMYNHLFGMPSNLIIYATKYGRAE